MSAQVAGQKRPAGGEAGAGADDIRNAFDVDISEEMHAKLKEASRVLLRAELANGAFVGFFSQTLFVLCIFVSFGLRSSVTGYGLGLRVSNLGWCRWLFGTTESRGVLLFQSA